MVSILVFLAVVCVVGLFFMQIFNRLVLLKNRFLNAFSQIEVQLKRRYDLIPSLVETAKGYLKHESETLEKVISARNTASKSLKNTQQNPADPTLMGALSQANQELSSAMSKLNFVMEDYPDLKANETMQQLHEEITTTENKVAFARQAYNDSVMTYNTYRQSFPQNILSTTFGHPNDATLLEFEDTKEIQQAPKVSF
ncbi:LemA family protein [Sulfurospirillum arcachonense]|uniref:LemA family protein n=1 Tax=Sulfurospirillum arcachonense TaxID=57666 RepID=UPI00046A970F|nr:LemA family protein [Sulfurospirillum arcachonense]